MKKKKVIILALIVLLSFFVSVGNIQAQEASCSIHNGNEPAGNQQGLELATLSENRGLSFSLVVIAGLIDGVNPCAMGMLILLLGYLLVFAKEPKKMLRIGLIYIITIYVTYFLIGLFFSRIVYSLLAWPYYAEVSHIIKYFIVVLIWIAALINIKDFFWYGKGLTLGVSKKEVPILMRYIKKVDWPATIVLGVLVTLFELPCSLPLYVGAIAVMTSAFNWWKTLGYLYVYNLMFVLPLFVVFAVILNGHKIFEMKDLQERGNKWMKLVMGLAQIIIGVALLLIK